MTDRKLSDYVSSENEFGIIRTVRDLPPAHFTLKVEAFSSILTENTGSLQSCEFEVDKYKWKVCVYPQGKHKVNGDEHLSLYLVFSESNKVVPGWEVHVSFKFLVYDQIQDKYLTIQDGAGRIRRFHEVRTRWGIDTILPLDVFKHASNGFLLNDFCAFGVDLYVVKNSAQGDTLSLKNIVLPNNFIWKIDNFSKIKQEVYSSQVFSLGDQKWRLAMYRNGLGVEEGRSMSLYLDLFNAPSLASNRNVYAEFILRINDQKQGNHCYKKGYHLFTSTDSGFGYDDMLSLSDLNQLTNGYIANNCLVVEVQFSVMPLVIRLQ